MATLMSATDLSAAAVVRLVRLGRNTMSLLYAAFKFPCSSAIDFSLSTSGKIGKYPVHRKTGD